MLSTTAATTWLLTALLTSMATDPAAGDAMASAPAAAVFSGPLDAALPPLAPVSPRPRPLPVASSPASRERLASATALPVTAAWDDVAPRPTVHWPEPGTLLVLLGGIVLKWSPRGRVPH
ncbi:MAG: hypothetical protein AB1601_06505 [Planctomycetota bacterium]